MAGVQDWKLSIDWNKHNWVHFLSNYGANKLSNSSRPLENRQNLSHPSIGILMSLKGYRLRARVRASI